MTRHSTFIIRGGIRVVSAVIVVDSDLEELIDGISPFLPDGVHLSVWRDWIWGDLVVKSEKLFFKTRCGQASLELSSASLAPVVGKPVGFYQLVLYLVRSAARPSV